jgi:hypothetical protein
MATVNENNCWLGCVYAEYCVYHGFENGGFVKTSKACLCKYCRSSHVN